LTTLISGDLLSLNICFSIASIIASQFSLARNHPLKEKPSSKITEPYRQIN
jgi:hypothetical protein